MQHIRILMLEDNPLDAELIERELLRAKVEYSAKRVETEQEFRGALESSDPDVILADYNLPRFDGASALKIARSLIPDTPFIFVSGSIGEERAVQALREGATDYILKDRLTRLVPAIMRALDERRERHLRMNAQEALQRSEERFQYAAQATQEVIWDWDIATGKVWFNDALTTVWDYVLYTDQMPFEWWEQRIHPDDRARIHTSLNQALLSDQIWTGVYRFERGDGSYGSVIDHAVIVRDNRGRATRVIAAMADITEREAAQETIRSLSRQNELILHYAAEAIVAVDRNGKPFVVNPAATKITGFSSEEFFAAANIHDLIHHSRPDGTPYPAAECPLVQNVSDGTVHIAQDLYWRKSGEPFAVEYSVSPIYERQEIAGGVVMFQDITERKRLEKQLEQANRVSSLGRVAATIAHEFNNVLMGIQPFAEVIRRKTEADEKVQKAAAQIMNSVARGKRVTQQILRFTQPAEPAFQTIVLLDWLNQLVPELRALIGQQIKIDIEAPQRPIGIRGDPAQLQQVVANLVLNARDAMTSAGTITLTIADDKEQRQFAFGQIPANMAMLAVRDPGSGMPRHVLETIFEPLFTTKRNGTGLGLAVAQQVVTRHGGAIHVQSAPGEGTTFFLLLPCTPPVTATEAEPLPRNGRIRRVLIVEDEEPVAAGIAALLEDEGIDSRIVHRGAEAVDAASAFKPDAVVLDLSLPDMNGIDVYAALKMWQPDLPLVFSTGHGDESALDRHIDSPTVGFLRKPYELKALLDELEKVTSAHGMGK